MNSIKTQICGLKSSTAEIKYLNIVLQFCLYVPDNEVPLDQQFRAHTLDVSIPVLLWVQAYLHLYRKKLLSAFIMVIHCANHDF